MYTEIIILTWLHFLGDFVLQSNSMATKKSKSIVWLGLHCFTYSLPMLYFGLKFAMVAMVTHFMVDYITSKITSKLHKEEERHWFFTTIGMDQAIHITILLTML